MKHKSGIFYLVMFLVAGLLITPALGSIYQAGYQKTSTENLENLTIDFVDCTGFVPVKKQVSMSPTQYNELVTELHRISGLGMPMRETIAAQSKLFQQHGLIASEMDINSFFTQHHQYFNTQKIHTLQHRIQPSPLNNTLFSVLSAITCTLENGTTIVLGLNSFINIIGFNIVSFHKGNATEGIQTNGILPATVPPGEYVGFMFGFFGYWFGTKTQTGVYSNVTVAGLTFITLWTSL